jgi:hypothetical protein
MGNEVARRERLRLFRWTPETEDLFFETLSDKGSVLAACRKVDAPRSSAYHRKDTDEAFEARWVAATKVAVARFEHAAIQRGVVGWEEPVFGSLGPDRGTGIVGYKRKFDSKLLLRVLAAHDPRYRATTPEQSAVVINIANVLASANDAARAKVQQLRGGVALPAPVTEPAE